MQIQFTEQSRRAIRYAQIEASESGSNCVEPEHLLLAILRDDHSEARVELREQGCSPGAVCEEVATFLDAQAMDCGREKETPPDRIALSLRGRAILETAAEVATRFGRRFVGPEHILMALVLKPTPLLALIWERNNVSVTFPSPDQFNTQLGSNRHERDEILSLSADIELAWGRYTDAAKLAVAHAQSEAMRSGFNEIPPLFLLSGVLQESETVVTDALKRCGVDRNTLREALIDVLPTGPGFDSAQEMVFDPGARTVVFEAQRIAETLSDRHIGTEHLFLGLLADRTGTGDVLRVNHLATANFLE
ncbi:MAG: hypothetical protein H8F28_02460, partial [Fibrella sp.]|nr:hypothetical protein [Armatimonadota bacterium]